MSHFFQKSDQEAYQCQVQMIAANAAQPASRTPRASSRQVNGAAMPKGQGLKAPFYACSSSSCSISERFTRTTNVFWGIYSCKMRITLELSKLDAGLMSEHIHTNKLELEFCPCRPLAASHFSAAFLIREWRCMAFLHTRSPQTSGLQDPCLTMFSAISLEWSSEVGH